MTLWQTDIVDTHRKALAALEKLLELYDRPTILEANGLVVWLEPSEVAPNTVTHHPPAPVETDAWSDVVRLTDSLARMGYFTIRDEVGRGGEKWVVTCHRSRESYAHRAVGGLMITRNEDFKTPTVGETVAIVRNYTAGRETIVRGGALQVTELPAMTVITVWKDAR